MGVIKRVLRGGNGVDKPSKGDEVVIDYTGCLHDPAAVDKNCMGDEFDSSRDRGEFKTTIGVGKVIRGICALLFFGPRIAPQLRPEAQTPARHGKQRIFWNFD
ncbi:hypothetical protein FQN55_008250 [Onygenales sp. PD_40]|nr:hypothetical protein FQN55_008250 [Onygenales sp. PD_40]